LSPHPRAIASITVCSATAAIEAFSALAHPGGADEAAGLYWLAHTRATRDGSDAATPFYGDVIARVPDSYYAGLAEQRLGLRAVAPGGQVAREHGLHASRLGLVRLPGLPLAVELLRDPGEPLLGARGVPPPPPAPNSPRPGQKSRFPRATWGAGDTGAGAGCTPDGT
jgi:hypothetical protein